MNASTEAAPAPSRRSVVSIILWVAARLPGFGVGMAGLAKFYAAARWEGLFASWGYPTWLSKMVGVIEVAGAVLIFIPRTTLHGAVILALTMLCAFLTLVTHPGGRLGWGAAPLVYFVWLGGLAMALARK